MEDYRSKKPPPEPKLPKSPPEETNLERHEAARIKLYGPTPKLIDEVASAILTGLSSGTGKRELSQDQRTQVANAIAITAKDSLELSGQSQGSSVTRRIGEVLRGYNLPRPSIPIITKAVQKAVACTTIIKFTEE